MAAAALHLGRAYYPEETQWWDEYRNKVTQQLSGGQQGAPSNHGHSSGAWLAAIMPPPDAVLMDSGRRLDMHKRLVQLASAAEEARLVLRQLQERAVALSEKKAMQQSRLIAALEARLQGAHAMLHTHQVAASGQLKALERAAAYCSDALRGLVSEPSGDAWAAATTQHQRLLEAKVAVPAELLERLDVALAPCQVNDVQAVEELRAERDSLAQQLRAAQAAQQEAALAAAEMQGALQALRQQHSGIQEMLAQRWQRPGGMSHNHVVPAPAVEPTSSSSAATEAPADSTLQGFQVQVRQLRQQFEQMEHLLKQQEAMLSEHGQHPAAASEEQTASGTCTGIGNPSAGFLPHLLQPSAPIQQLRHAVHQHRHSCCCGSAVRCCCGASTSGGGESGCESTREAALKRSYQGMLQQLQARYQCERQQMELQHKQELEAQSHAHTEALTSMARRQEEALHKLLGGPGTGTASDLCAQLQRLRDDNATLNRRLTEVSEELRSRTGPAPLSAVAAAAVAHCSNSMPGVGQSGAAHKALECLEAQHRALLGELRALTQGASESDDTGAVGAKESQWAAAWAAAGGAPSVSEQHQRSGSASPERRRGFSPGRRRSVSPVRRSLSPVRCRGGSPAGVSVQLRSAGAVRGSGHDHEHDGGQMGGWQGSVDGGAAGGASTPTSVHSPMSDLIHAVLGSSKRQRQWRHEQQQQQQQQQQQDHEVQGRQQQQQQRQQQQQENLLDLQGDGPSARAYRQQLAMLDQVLGIKHLGQGPGSRSPPRQQPQQPAGVPLVHPQPWRGAGVATAAGKAGPSSPVRRRSPGRPHAASNAEVVPRCLRCGLTDDMSPGSCSFHPALVPAPGPLLHGPEWYHCRGGAHLPNTPGCYTRTEHFFGLAGTKGPSAQQAGAAAKQAVGSGTAAAGGDAECVPRPRSQLPMPSK